MFSVFPFLNTTCQISLSPINLLNHTIKIPKSSKMASLHLHPHHHHRRLGYFYSPPPLPPSPPYFQIPYTLVKPKESHSKTNLNPSFMIIAIILVLVFFVSVSIHLILRYLNRRCMSTEENDDVASSTEPVHVHHISSRRVVPEAHQSLIDSLPLFSFNKISSGLKSSSADCAVCLSKFEMNDQLRLLPLCCHAFHSTCIDTWLGSNHTCPLCRSTVLVDGSEGYLKLFSSSSSRSESFRVEIGNVSSSTRIASDTGITGITGNDRRRSYSIGSFEYLVEDETAEILVEPTHRRVTSEIVPSVKKEEDEATFPPLETERNLNPNPNPPGAEIAAEVSSGGRGWLKDYVDRLSVSSASISSRTLSFRLSGRFFTGSSRRSEGFTGSSRRSYENGGSWDLERNEYGEQIGGFLRWLSGV